MRRRFLTQPLTVVGLVLLVLVALITIVGPLVYDASPTRTNPMDAYAPPSGRYPLGTDQLGRDILARLLHAGLLSIPSGLLAVGIGAVVGSLVGIASGFIGGIVDAIVMRAVDVLLSFPTLLTAIVVVAILGPSVSSAVVAVSIAALPSYARVMRGSVLPLRTAAFIQAARVSNTPLLRLLRVHVLPNVADVLVVLLVIGMGNGIVVLSALSFLGIGVQPPEADWGVMLTEGVRAIFSAPVAALAPAVVLMATVLGINFVGEGLGAALRVDTARRRPR
ncbi:ABC transporter permease [Dactylosporangium fulvum]|uniref:ABC transporter permease n=1 Tax=Dactylosporangium fulvum TaxID=53359 RepID=A0ABY5VS15_9ACTN|nr:ABC transporter permease [Dactylosporangium fulvum]UWP79992.1 ABC transporter permease [Dactylosporangium fulvum]